MLFFLFHKVIFSQANSCWSQIGVLSNICVKIQKNMKWSANCDISFDICLVPGFRVDQTQRVSVFFNRKPRTDFFTIFVTGDISFRRNPSCACRFWFKQISCTTVRRSMGRLWNLLFSSNSGKDCLNWKQPFFQQESNESALSSPGDFCFFHTGS